jgi:hypothetical protein
LLPEAVRANLRKIVELSQLDTPMMKQFCAVKEDVPDALLFFFCRIMATPHHLLFVLRSGSDWENFEGEMTSEPRRKKSA